MFAPMMASGGSGETLYNMTYGFLPYSNRWSYKSGGFRVKNGVCYVNAVLTANINISSGQSAMNTGTVPTVSSTQGTSWTDFGDIKVRYNASITEQFQFNKAISSGADISFVGQYYTNAPDTEAI